MMLTIRTLPRSVLSAPTRHQLARVVKWRPGLVEVPIDRLLLGEQNGVSAEEFAAELGDLAWASRPVAEGPHAELLRRAAAEESLTDEEILSSSYGQMARACIRRTGRYFTATDDAGIVTIARGFVDRTATAAQPGAGSAPAGTGHSPEGQPVLVAPVTGSECYQVLDGHHRIAASAVRGEKTVPVRVRRGSVTTPLQERLRTMSWLEGRPLLYQPVDAPEVAAWPTVRRCDDRLTKMNQFLASVGIEPEGSSYLDVASCYGWFVHQMSEAGYDGHGIERDPLAPELGKAVYGLDPARIEVGDAVELLHAKPRRFHVVSCFSLLHHFVLGRGNFGFERLLEELDEVTERVLFIDTGQDHEQWFHRSLAGWDVDRIRRELLRHTTFDSIHDLGPDADAVPPYERNYGRHLFACVREQG